MTIINLESAKEIKGEKIFVDANILIFVDGSHSFDEKEKLYSDLYFSLLKHNKLYTTEKCLGEFSNRLTKLHYSLDKENNPSILDFKRHRKSDDFATSMSCIFDATCQFMEDLNVITSYDDVDVRQAFKDVQTGLIDYADILAARICLSEGMYFFSDDGDAVYCRDLKIITNNAWAISSSRRRDRIACL